jgi:hypothetical protein
MAHVRKQIRDAVATQLTGLTTTDSNVYVNRLYPIAQSKLPGLLVYTNSEASSKLDMHYPRLLERRLEVVVEGVVKTTSSIEDLLDTIAQEVEEAVYTDVTLGGLCKDVVLTSIETDFASEGDQPVGVVKLEFEAKYVVRENDLSVAL